jgi:cell fate regulator YaaT (PSP1 superfamily)
LIEVAFKGNRKEFYLWEHDEVPPVRTPVIVEADRGEDLGRVHSTGDAAQLRCRKCSHGLGDDMPTRRALRKAVADDVRRELDLRKQDEDARRRGADQVRTHDLAMKLSDAEWQWDGRKLTFYFTAEKRVDFRKLVRDLASAFRTRIELKQIGVRDEAKRLDGIGRCGRQYCSASWLPELRPVNLGVAKDQHLSLNPTQISGACGRLMCSLRYEHEFYVQARKRFPKEGKTVVTIRGDEKVMSNDIFRDRVTLRNGEGDLRTIPLLDLRAEIEEAQRRGVEGGDGESAFMSTGEWERLSARQLPLAQGATGEEDYVVIDEDDVDGDAAEDELDESASSTAAPPPAAPDSAPPRRRRGRRGGRRGRRRRGGDNNGHSPNGNPAS